MDDYASRGWKYAEDVAGGQIPNGKYAIAACKRSLRDREQENTPTFPYVFDPDKANRVCQFVEFLPNVAGPAGGTLIHLEDWQCWLLGQLFGWNGTTGRRKDMRRFRRAYIAVPRGNGKSTLASAISLYMLAADGDAGAEVYSSATTQAQARIIFGDAKAMASHELAKEFMNYLGISVHAHAITVAKSNSKFVALSAESKSLDGLKISFCTADELHAHPTREVFDVLTTGCGKRPQSLLLAVTTAGTNRSGICYEIQGYCQQVLDQTFFDESQFGVIYAADLDDDWRSVDTLIKASPNWDVSVDPDYVVGEMKQAENSPSKINNFKTKFLNLWVSSDSPWMDMDKFIQCGDATLKLEHYLGRKCWIGVDLANVSDICSKCYFFKEDREDGTHYVMFHKNYLSEAAIRDGRNASYSGWAHTGLITETPGNVTDYRTIQDDLLQDLKDFDVQEIAFDPWQAQATIQVLMEQGALCVEIPKNIKNYSEPMKELERLALTGRLHHDGNPLLIWSFGNVRADLDPRDNVMATKDRPSQKIDLADAAIMGLTRAMLAQDLYLGFHVL